MIKDHKVPSVDRKVDDLVSPKARRVIYLALVLAFKPR